MNNRARILLYPVLFFLLSSFIDWSWRNPQIEALVSSDYTTYIYMKNNPSVIDSVFRFTYISRWNKSTFRFNEKYDPLLNKKMVRVTLYDTIYQINITKDSCAYSVEVDSDSIDSNLLNRVRRDVLYYDKLFKKINCSYIDGSRLGYGLIYIQNKDVEPNNNFVFIKENWYYDCSRMSGLDRKRLLRAIDKYFGTHLSN
jgi:hypothetical protein